MRHTHETKNCMRKIKENQSDIIWFIRDDNGVQIVENLSLFARINDLSKGTLHQVSSGLRKRYKGIWVKRLKLSLLQQIDKTEQLIRKYAPELLVKFKKWVKKVESYIDADAFEKYISNISSKDTSKRSYFIVENESSQDVFLYEKKGRKYYKSGKTGEEYVTRSSS